MARPGALYEPPDQASTRIDEQAFAEIVTIELVVALLGGDRGGRTACSRS